MIYLKCATLILVFSPVKFLVFPAAVERLMAASASLVGLKSIKLSCFYEMIETKYTL